MEWSEVFPIQAIEQEILINGNGDLTIGFKVNFQPSFTMSKTEIEDDLEKWDNFLTSLPSDTVLHMQSHYYPESGEEKSFNLNYAIKRNRIVYDSTPMMKSISYLFLTFPTNKKTKKKNVLFTKADYLLNKPFTELEKALESVERSRRATINTLSILSSIDNITILNEAELKRTIYKYINGTYDDDVDDFSRLSELSVNNKGFLLARKNVGVVSLLNEGSVAYYVDKGKQIPPEVLENDNPFVVNKTLSSSMMYPLSLGLPIEHIVNTVITIKDNSEIIDELNTGFNKVRFMQMIDNKAKSKSAAIKDFAGLLNINGLRACTLGQNIIVKHSDEKILEKYLDIITASYKEINGTVPIIESKISFESFHSCIPGNANYFPRNIIACTIYAACYLPREGFFKTEKEGFYYLDMYGNPIKENIFFSNETVNKNLLVFGPSGSGKTNFLCTLINNAININISVIMINVKPDYKYHCQDNDGLFIDTNDDKLKSINPFYCRKQKGKWIGKEKIILIKSIIIHVWKTKGEILGDEDNLLTQIIEEYYNYINEPINGIEFPNFSSFFEYLDVFEKELSENKKGFINFDSLRLALQTFYKGGINEEVFASVKPLDVLDENYLSYDLNAVLGNEILFNIYLYYIIDLSLEKIKVNGNSKFTLLLLDECIDSMKGKGGEFVGEMFRKIRSLNGGIGLCTQGAEYLDSLDDLIKKSILINSDIKILLKHKKVSIPETQKMLSLSDDDVLKLESIELKKEYRDFLLKKGDGSAKILRNKSSEYGLLQSTTDPDEVLEIETEYNRLKDSGVDSIRIALNNIINNRNKKHHEEN